MKGKSITKKLLAVLLALAMVLAVVPAPVFADEHDNQVRVIVENTTYTAASGAAWDGTLVDTWVDISESSTMMTCIVAALNTVKATQTGAESNYITSVNGLSAGSAGGYDGWMMTLNDWFTNDGAAVFTVANGKLGAGDEIRLMYSLTMGEDIGGSWSNNDKTLSNITFSAGELSAAFSKDTHEYTLTLPAGTQSVTVTPTASNKNFLVKNYLGTQSAGTEYKRTAAIPVTDGSVITVVCGDPAWPSMNGGEYGTADSVAKETYTFNVVVTQLEPSLLESLIVHTGTSPSNTSVLLQNADDTYTSTQLVFNPTTYTYTLAAQADTLTQLRFRAKAADSGATVKVCYGSDSKDITWTSGSSKWANCLSGGRNTVTIVVTPSDSSKAETTYTLIIDCIPSLTALSASTDTAQLYLDKNFATATKEYTLTVPSDEQYVTVNPSFRNNAYSATYNGSADNRVDITGKDKIDVIVKTGSGESLVENTYTLTLSRVDALNFKPVTTPSDAVVKVYDHKKNEIAPNADGSFSGLFGVNTYTYTVSKYGYVTQTGSVPAAGGNLVVTLAENAENTLADVGSEWKNFRNSDVNMGITDAKTPTVVSDTALLWNKKLGSGWNNAPSVQIIADDALIVMSSTNLYKLDLETGDILATGTMAAAPNFGYTPPTYADGMIFCPLSGGIVQAFDAKTLESLWVYTDMLGGQSLSPITYSDGYIYTGFWNGEVNAANFAAVSVSDDDPLQTNEAKYATWTHSQAGGFYWAGSMVAGDYVYVGTDDGASGATGTSYIYSFDKKTGNVVSRLALSGAGDQRSTIAYDKTSGKIYFTTKGGWLYSASIDETTGVISNLKGVDYNAQSTSTPIVYKGAVYFATGSGISTSGSSGNFVVADADTLQMMYYVGLKGYPQCSMLLSTAYESEGYLYFYSTYNNTPGGISMIKVANGATTAQGAQLIELYDAAGFEQYCITSLICGEDGTLYYKNDSANVFAVGVPKYTQVINLINNIGTVTAESGSAIKTAADAYNALSDENKLNVTNYQTLLDAASAYDNLLAAEAMAKIDAIGTVTLSSENNINAALTAYNALTDAQKALVVNYAKLTDAVTELSKLKVQECIGRINAIGEVTLAKKDAIVSARTYYSSLTDSEKALVSNYSALTSAEAALQKLKDAVPAGSTKSVKVTINGVAYEISEATAASADKITALLNGYNAGAYPEGMDGLTDEQLTAVVDAYKSYSALSEDEKLFVSNYKEFEENILNKIGEAIKTDKATGIKASNLDWNIKITVKPTPIDEETEKKIKDQLGNDSKVILLNDISFTDILTGKEYSPAGDVEIRIPIENAGEFNTYAIVHIADDGSLEFIEAKVDNGYLVFNSQDFSLYAAAGFSGSWSDLVPMAASRNLTWLWAGLCLVGVIAAAYVIIARKKEAAKQ